MLSIGRTSVHTYIFMIRDRVNLALQVCTVDRLQLPRAAESAIGVTWPQQRLHILAACWLVRHVLFCF
jgi:hypothetical protein